VTIYLLYHQNGHENVLYRYVSIQYRCITVPWWEATTSGQSIEPEPWRTPGTGVGGAQFLVPGEFIVLGLDLVQGLKNLFCLITAPVFDNRAIAENSTSLFVGRVRHV